MDAAVCGKCAEAAERQPELSQRVGHDRAVTPEFIGLDIEFHSGAFPAGAENPLAKLPDVPDVDLLAILDGIDNANDLVHVPIQANEPIESVRRLAEKCAGLAHA